MSRRSKILLFTLGITALLIAYWAYGCDHVAEQSMSLPSPLENVTVHTFSSLEWITSSNQRIAIHLKEESDTKRLVDLRVFGDLQPEMTEGAAAARLGKPVQEYTDDFGGTWSRYPTLLGYAEIGVDRRTSISDDGDKNPIAGRRSLRSYTDRPLSDIVSAPVLDLIRQVGKTGSRVRDQEVDFYNSEHRLILDISLKNGRISSMELFRHVER